MFKFFLTEILSSYRHRQFSAILNFQYYGKWKKYNKQDISSLTAKLPWINFPAIDFLNKHLKPSDCVFEYGGGGSSLYFLERVNEVTTVEHDDEWFMLLEQKISESVKRRWNGNLLKPKPLTAIANPSYLEPEHYYSSDKIYEEYQFKDYVSYIDKFDDGFFDWVLIDGRARPSCIKHAVSKIKAGGFLILDNAERSYYLEHTHLYLQNFKLVLSKHSPVPFLKTFTITNIWQKQFS